MNSFSFGTQLGVMFYKVLINSFLCFVLCTSAFTQNQSPREAALCFYNWYLQAIKGPANAHTAIVKKGPNGETVLDYTQYFPRKYASSLVRIISKTRLFLNTTSTSTIIPIITIRLVRFSPSTIG
jgi:hypothetical protein